MATLAVALAFLLILSAGLLVGALCVVAYVCWPYSDAGQWGQAEDAAKVEGMAAGGYVPAQPDGIKVRIADATGELIFPERRH